ncbi:MAG: hypothetical protein OJF47_001563 [Nitrospira sp.]|jgi:hypothetical protein|nr:MAG: hypothetical protein OJF47_001563 [Nitrospira sp.]
MDQQKKEQYAKPELVKHELLRDVTAIALSRCGRWCEPK